MRHGLQSSLASGSAPAALFTSAMSALIISDKLSTDIRGFDQAPLLLKVKADGTAKDIHH